MHIPSKLITDAVHAFSGLPGIGEKTALRLVLHLLKQDKNVTHEFAHAIEVMRNEIKFCKKCHSIADTELCHICTDGNRDNTKICVVESIRDVIAIENTGIFRGTYHVLGGLISPIDGIGPDQLTIASLIERINTGQVQELIMALNPTMEGDTTIFYISKLITDKPIQVTSISRGIAFGGELEYTDELTLSKSISGRIPFEKYLGR